MRVLSRVGGWRSSRPFNPSWKPILRPKRVWPGVATLTVLGIGSSFALYSTSRKNSSFFPPSVKDDQEKSPWKAFEDTKKAIKAQKPEIWTLPAWPKPNIDLSLPSLPNLPSFPSPSFDLPTWSWPESLTKFRTSVDTLLMELSGGKGSLYRNVVSQPPDPNIHPECAWDAEVRLGDDLSLGEKAYIHTRRRRMRESFGRLMGVEPHQIDERDIPTVAIAGSGGGLRACMNTIGALGEFQENGLLDCVMYVAGISGSCWALGTLYSGIAGSSPILTAEHLKSRIQVPYVDSSALELLTRPPTNAYLLTGLIRKASMPGVALSLTDIYGTLVSSRILVPDDLGRLDPTKLSLHHFRQNVDNGTLPLPIFTAISRELPEPLRTQENKVKDGRKNAVDLQKRTSLEDQQGEINAEARWLWFEFTPFEVGCDEIGAWIPSWALGRTFEGGRSRDRVPEVSFTILSGIFASAFCASLQHYFKEVEPVLRQLPPGLFKWISDMIKDSDTDLDTFHPIVPNGLPNFLKGLDGQLRTGTPGHLTELKTLGFMDAGAELNIPYYPLFRRNVDCVIALDASADSQDLWFTKAEQFALKRGLSTWPRGARWPTIVNPTESMETNRLSRNSEPRSSDPVVSATRKLAISQETQIAGQQNKQDATKHHGLPNRSERPDDFAKHADPSSTSQIASPSVPPGAHLWIGSSKDEGKAVSYTSGDDIDEEILASQDGIGILYLPLVANTAVTDFNPLSISTWRLDLTPEESDKLIHTSRHNVRDGHDMIVKVLRAMWLRKRTERLKSEDDTEALALEKEHSYVHASMQG